MVFRENLKRNCKNLESILIRYGMNFETVVELAPTDKITSRRLHQFWMHKIKIIDSTGYLYVGKHPLYGFIFRDTINSLYYVRGDLINSWYDTVIL